MNKLDPLLKKIRGCTECAQHLPLGPRPVLRAGSAARIMIIGQAPGTRVHATGIPWEDPSGDRLREWLGIDKTLFYDESRIAIVPMGFCYPGKGKSGDLPPRPECAPLWHGKLFAHLKQIQLILLIGQYSQAYYLGEKQIETLTETVRAWKEYGPRYFPLPHPSPRNNIWLKKNPWFGRQALPELRKSFRRVVGLRGLSTLG